MTGIKPADPAPFTRYDEYAAHRCACKHLVYANQRPGDPCLFCACQAHRVPGAAKS